MVDMSRRQSLALGTSAGLALGVGDIIAGDGKARAGDLPAAADVVGFAKEEGSTDTKEINKLHGGKGAVKTRRFGFSGASVPTNFVAFDIPPGASEGVHVHGIGLPTGPYDEYYFIASGTGVMQIDGEIVPVEAGDHVHTPMGVHHGVENTAASGNLKVLVTYITKT